MGDIDIIQGDGKSVIDKYGNSIILKDDQRLYKGNLQAKFKRKNRERGYEWRNLCKNIINENGERCQKRIEHKKDGFCYSCYSKENRLNDIILEEVGLEIKDENNNNIILKKDQRLFNGKLQAKFKDKRSKKGYQWCYLCKNINENNERCEKIAGNKKDGFCYSCYSKANGLNNIILEEVGLEVKDENNNTIILKKDQRLFNGKLQQKFKCKSRKYGDKWFYLCENINKNNERCEKRQQKDGLCREHCPIDENLRGKTKYKEIKYVDGTTYMAKFRNDGKNQFGEQLCKNCDELG